MVKRIFIAPTWVNVDENYVPRKGYIRAGQRRSK
jgi:hypothetical protein